MKKSMLILVLIGVAIITILLFFFNPVETDFAPRCIFKQTTGLSCAGCGMQRFLHAFLHGRFAEAISYNYFIILLIPYSILFCLERLVLTGNIQKRFRKVIEGRIVLGTLIAIVPCWIVLRNLLHI